MQPSQYEIQREVEALRDIRRRSTSQGGPGALLLDPDLPNGSPPPSPTAAHWSPGMSTPPLSDTATVSSHEGEVGHSDRNPQPVDDPFHLFWVPANLHPEIAPAEFRAFLKEHARAPLTDGTVHVERSDSTASGSSLGRKRSMLSRQYKPSETDGPEEDNENVIPLRRNHSIYSTPGPQLTISDLQKLEELAEQASESDDPSKLRNILRRSLSLNMSPSEVVNQMDGIPDLGDEADSPIIVPPPGQILRRSARTKIRKASLPGDGNGHRFKSRRGRGAKAATSPIERPVSDPLANEQEDQFASSRRRPFSSEPPARPESFSEESAIYDAYARDDDDDEDELSIATSTSPIATTVQQLPEPLPPQPAPPFIYQPQPQRLGVPPPADPRSMQRTPSPDASSISSPPSDLDYPRTSPRQPLGYPSAPTPPGQQRKDSDKKGLFGMWGSGSKSGKKGSKDKERENRERTDSGFFGSLFSTKKKQDDGQTLGHTMSGRETAAALLGGSKSSKSYVPSTSPLLGGQNGSYARYPIHVERAIYRLSHIKLANPRRPLYEQVLISNLMFWYLGVINKTQSAMPTTGGQAEGQETPSAAEKEQKEEEEWIKAKEKERLEKERLEMEIAEKERFERERTIAEPKKDTRRGPLTRPTMPGASTRRAAEMPIKAPQYDLQHRVMEQEYVGFVGQPSGPMGRPLSSSPPGHPRMQQTPGPSNQFSSPTKGIQQQLQSQQADYYYGGGGGGAPTFQEFSEQPQSQRRGSQLPPGAMPPVDGQSTWLTPSTSTSKRRSSSPPPAPLLAASPGYPGPRHRSPPPPNVSPPSNRYTPPAEKARASGRSLSATAVPSTPQNMNEKLRKGMSANATIPLPNGRPRTSDGVGGEEEDVPLAIWQQQRRR